jgi:hypothetical protein
LGYQQARRQLRHTHGPLPSLAGTTLKCSAVAMGHSDIRMTERHTLQLQESDEVAGTIRAILPCFDKTDSKVATLWPNSRKPQPI